VPDPAPVTSAVLPFAAIVPPPWLWRKNAAPLLNLSALGVGGNARHSPAIFQKTLDSLNLFPAVASLLVSVREGQKGKAFPPGQTPGGHDGNELESSEGFSTRSALGW